MGEDRQTNTLITILCTHTGGDRNKLTLEYAAKHGSR